MARKTAAQAAITRETLLHTGLCVFSEHGYSSTSLEMIAARAGYTRGAVYWHFGNKQDLLCALLDGISLPIEIVSITDLKETRLRVQRLLDALGRTLSEDCSRRFCSILLNGDRSNTNSPLAIREGLLRGRIKDAIDTLLAGALDKGELVPGADVSGGTELLVACVMGSLLDAARAPHQQVEQVAIVQSDSWLCLLQSLRKAIYQNRA